MGRQGTFSVQVMGGVSVVCLRKSDSKFSTLNTGEGRLCLKILKEDLFSVFPSSKMQTGKATHPLNTLSTDFCLADSLCTVLVSAGLSALLPEQALSISVPRAHENQNPESSGGHKYFTGSQCPGTCSPFDLLSCHLGPQNSSVLKTHCAFAFGLSYHFQIFHD